MNYKLAISSLGLSFFLAGIATAQAKLENVQVDKTTGGVKLTFTGTSLSSPKLTTAYQGKVVFVDFKAHLKGKAKTSQVNSGGIKYFRAGWHGRPPYARVAVYLTNPALKPWVAPAGNGTWTLNFGPKASALDTSAYNDVYSDGKFDLLPPIQTSEYLPPVETKTAPPTNLKDAIIAAGIAPVNTKIYKEPIVSLDFSNAEITLILRGLADQSGVNIVTSPDVSGRISVNLESVTLTDALNLVTTIANVRYTKIGKTYLVTSTARFSDAIRQVIGKLDEAGETRVIQLRSGEGKQIKAATLKALPQLATDGYYDLILPTEKISAKTTSGTGTTQVNSGNAGPGAGSGPQTGGGAGTGPQTGGGSGGQGTGVSASMSETQGSSVSLSSETEGSTGKDTYLVVVANTERIGPVVSFIENLDRKIAEANSLAGSTAIETRAIALYSPNDDVVLDAVKNMASRDPRASSFKISVSSAGIVGQLNAMKLLVINGPASGVDDLAYVARATDRSIARALGIAIPDEGAEAQRGFVVLDLNFIEPAYAMNQLTLHIRGLAVSLMPPSVEPGAKGAVETSVKDNGQSSGGATSSAAGNGGQAGSPDVSKNGQDSESKTEIRGTEPMKLLVYGSHEQVAAARSLLTVIDVEPKVVALELRVLELSKEDALQAGINWNIFSNGDIGFIRVNQALGSAGQAGGVGVTPPAGRRNGHSITGVLDAITTKNNLISRPNTLAMDGRPTYLFVGDTVRYVESIQSTQQGVTVTSGKVDVGVTLAVTPRVGADGTLTIRLAPNLTILRGFTDVPGGGQLPQTSERRADTTFTMNDGDTIAIGGLITDQDRKSFGGIPFLRDIPILGRLFGRTDNQRIRSEVVFFVTAKIVDKAGIKNNADPRNSEKKAPIDPSKEKVVPKIGNINP